MDTSGLFNKPEYADVLLKLLLLSDQTAAADEINVADASAAATGEPATASRKRVRSEADEARLGVASAEPAACPALSRTLHLHKIILLQSEYFKWCIDRRRSAETAQSGETSASAVPMLELVEMVPEGQLEAAVLAIECMYNSAAPARAAGDAMLLLNAYQLADRFRIPSACMDKIAAALASLLVSHAESVLQTKVQLDPFINHNPCPRMYCRYLFIYRYRYLQVDVDRDHMGVLQSILNLPDIFGPSSAMTQLRTMCSAYLLVTCTNATLSADPLLLQGLRDLLLSVFGDVPAVITCEERRSMFCFLPLAAVFVWVKEDSLKVRRESYV